MSREQHFLALIEQQQSSERDGKLVQVQERIKETLTDVSPDSFYGDETEEQKAWLVQREESISSFGNDALVRAFPEEAHSCSYFLLEVLSRKGINTISQLVSQKEDRGLVNGLGPMKREVINIIAGEFS